MAELNGGTENGGAEAEPARPDVEPVEPAPARVGDQKGEGGGQERRWPLVDLKPHELVALAKELQTEALRVRGRDPNALNTLRGRLAEIKVLLDEHQAASDKALATQRRAAQRNAAEGEQRPRLKPGEKYSQEVRDDVRGRFGEEQPYYRIRKETGVSESTLVRWKREFRAEQARAAGEDPGGRRPRGGSGGRISG